MLDYQEYTTEIDDHQGNGNGCVFRSKSAGFSEQTGHPFGLNRPPSRSKSATPV